LKRKSDVKDRLKEFVESCKTKFGLKPKILRSDKGGEYVGKEMQEYLKKEGIAFQHSVAYSPLVLMMMMFKRLIEWMKIRVRRRQLKDRF
jgi:hypothetical protein